MINMPAPRTSALGLPEIEAPNTADEQVADGQVEGVAIQYGH